MTTNAITGRSLNQNIKGIIMPKVSILIPVYNREDFIQDCIISAINQSYTDCEIIIVDNCSTDKTLDKIIEISNYTNNIKYFQNNTNIGPVLNWIECLKLSSGEYIKFLFSDDLLTPNCIEKSITYIENNDIAFVTSSALIGQDLNNCTTYYRTSNDDFLIDSNEYINKTLSFYGKFFAVSPCAALFRRKDVEKNLLNNNNFPININYDFNHTGAGVDWLLFLITATSYKKVAVISQPLVFFGAHKDSLTIKNEGGLIPQGYQIAKKWFLDNFTTQEKNNDPAPIDINFKIARSSLHKNYNSNVTIFCSVWSKQKNKEELLRAHVSNLKNLNYKVDILYIFDSNDKPPIWLDENFIVIETNTTIYNAWAIATKLIKTRYAMNLNLDDRLSSDSIEILLDGISSNDAALASGEWLISFENPINYNKFNSFEYPNTNFHPDWPPIHGQLLRLGSGTGERGTYGPATIWDLNKVGKDYPFKFDSGKDILSIGDSLFWGFLKFRKLKIIRINKIIGVYYSNPNEQAEFRASNEWANKDSISFPLKYSIKIHNIDRKE